MMIIISYTMEETNPADAVVEESADSTTFTMSISESKEVILSSLEQMKDSDLRAQCVRKLVDDFLNVQIFQESLVLNLRTYYSSFNNILRYPSLSTQSLHGKKNSLMTCYSARNLLQMASLLAQKSTLQIYDAKVSDKSVNISSERTISSGYARHASKTTRVFNATNATKRLITQDMRFFFITL